MTYTWKRVSWGDLCTLEYGKSLNSYKQTPDFARVFGTNGPIGWHHEGLWTGPGIILGRKGAYRGVHFSDSPYWVIDTAYSLQPKVALNLKWAYYVLHHSGLDHINDGSPIPSTTRAAFYKEPVALPSQSEQDAIADILGSLDAKITLNREMAATLEAIARALFQSWFVDFDPVRRAAVGEDTGLPHHLAALFPARLADNGLPEGWTIKQVSDVFDIVAGNTPSTDDERFWGGPHAWTTPKDLSRLSTPVLLASGRTLSEAGLAACSSGMLPSGTLLLSSRAPIGYLGFANLPTAINQGIAAFRCKKLSTSFAWAWCQAEMPLIKASANGSTFLEISKGILRRLPMIQASEAVMQSFVSVTDPLLERIVTIAEQNLLLATLRDTLLPKLISGELRIRDAEKIAESA